MRLGAVPVVPNNDRGIPITAIGPGKPLSLRIMSIYPGQYDHKAMLLSSAVKSPAVYEGAPRAAHYVFDRVPGGQVLVPSADQPGSDVVYYSPALLDDQLHVTLTQSFDDFDLDTYLQWLATAKAAAELPVFATTATIVDPVGTLGRRAVMYAAENAIKVVLGALDKWVDGENDWISNWKLNISRAGLVPAQAGWVVFFGDNEQVEVLAPSEGDWAQQVLSSAEQAYAVDTQNSTLIWKETGQLVTEQPYILGFVNGAEEKSLEKWKATAVSAATANKFLAPSSAAADDVSRLLSTYSDAQLALRVAAIDEKIKALPEADTAGLAKLTEQRESVLKNVQDDKFREVLSK